MILLSSHVAVTGAIDTFNLTYGAALPDAVRELLATALGGGSPVDRMCQAAEVLYANRAAITDTAAKAAAMTLAAQCAVWAGNPANAFHGMDAAGADGVSRGVGIYWAMQRELGETAPTGTSWPDPSADPPAAAAWTLPVVD